MSTWFGKGCQYHRSQCERCVSDCSQDKCVPVLVLCVHPDNPHPDYESNCNSVDCPLGLTDQNF